MGGTEEALLITVSQDSSEWGTTTATHSLYFQIHINPKYMLNALKNLQGLV